MNWYSFDDGEKIIYINEINIKKATQKYLKKTKVKLLNRKSLKNENSNQIELLYIEGGSIIEKKLKVALMGIQTMIEIKKD